MAKKDSKTSIKLFEKPLIKLNTAFNDLLDNISGKNINSRDKELKQLNREIDTIIYKELDNISSVTGKDLSTFLTKLFNSEETENRIGNIKSKTIDELFENDTNGLYSFFQERHRNQNLLFEDLHVITSQLFEIQEALNTTRDGIIAADSAGEMVSRILNIETDSEKKSTYIDEIKLIEKKMGLLKKIKNHIVPNTLKFGKYYVYIVPYSELFKSYHNKISKARHKLSESSHTLKKAESGEFEYLRENYAAMINKTDMNKVLNDFNSICENIEVYNNDNFSTIFEDSEISALIDEKFRKQADSAIKKANNTKSFNKYADGTVSIDNDENQFSDIKGCYIKMIDPRRIVPIEVMDEIIGYYYIHTSPATETKLPFTSVLKIESMETVKNIETNIIGKIANRIVKSFDKKFLEDNSKFKDLIINALIYNDLYRKKIKFQFIPVDYIQEFQINEDENGKGTSMLLPALFYAKLYLALLIFKMISIISKSNDQKVYYVKQSGIDKNVANKIQDVARAIKAGQINFMDLMNYNNMVSKIGRAKEIFMPIGQSGEKGIDFDVISGQDIQLNTELMEMLKTGYINATGVPSVILNYVNEADYAKTLVMANNKHLMRVVSYQLDFNESITEFYKKIFRFTSSFQGDEGVIEGFTFTLAKPKALDTNNLVDLVNNMDNLIQYIVKVTTGEQTDQTEDMNLMKEIIIKKLNRIYLPMVDWDEIDEVVSTSKIEFEKVKLERSIRANQDNNSGM